MAITKASLWQFGIDLSQQISDEVQQQLSDINIDKKLQIIEERHTKANINNTSHVLTLNNNIDTNNKNVIIYLGRTKLFEPDDYSITGSNQITFTETCYNNILNDDDIVIFIYNIV